MADATGNGSGLAMTVEASNMACVKKVFCSYQVQVWETLSTAFGSDMAVMVRGWKEPSLS